jgi:L-ascorbate 6-phosphate lactonase
MVPGPVRPEDVRADAVICTHHHEDHTDEGTLPGIASADPYILFWGPSRSIALCRKWKIREDRLRTINRGQNENIADFNVFAHYADHSEDSISLVLISGKTRIAITGDSRYHDRLTTGLKSHAPQVLITVINGKLGNMDPAEAAVLTRELNPCLVIPCHYGMFEKNTVDPQLFVSALTQYGLRERAHIMEQCGRFVYPS